MAHITQQEREPILISIKKNREFLNNTSKLLASLKRNQDPITSVQEINAKSEEFNNVNIVKILRIKSSRIGC